MFLPGHARLIYTLFEPENEKTYLRGYHQVRYKPPCSVTQTAKLLKFRNYKYCYIQVVNRNGADQTARICRQVDTLKFVVPK